MQKVRHIAQNTDHFTQNDGLTMQNVGRNTLNVCQGAPPGPLYLKKLKCLEMIFRTLGKKINKIKSDN